jgi:predicted GNAT family acetyltransferase
MAEQEIRHNDAAHRFEAGQAPNLARLDYRMSGHSVDMIHVEVPEEYQGQGLAGSLTLAALNWAREKGLKVIPSCPYVKVYLKKHPEFADLV